MKKKELKFECSRCDKSKHIKYAICDECKNEIIDFNIKEEERKIDDLIKVNNHLEKEIEMYKLQLQKVVKRIENYFIEKPKQ